MCGAGALARVGRRLPLILNLQPELVEVLGGRRVALLQSGLGPDGQRQQHGKQNKFAIANFHFQTEFRVYPRET